VRSTYTIMSVASDASYDADQLQFEFSPEASPEASIESIEFDPEPDVMYYVDMLQTEQRLKQEIDELMTQLHAKQQEIETIKSKLAVAK